MDLTRIKRKVTKTGIRWELQYGEEGTTEGGADDIGRRSDDPARKAFGETMDAVGNHILSWCGLPKGYETDQFGGPLWVADVQIGVLANGVCHLKVEATKHVGLPEPLMLRTPWIPLPNISQDFRAVYDRLVSEADLYANYIRASSDLFVDRTVEKLEKDIEDGGGRLSGVTMGEDGHPTFHVEVGEDTGSENPEDQEEAEGELGDREGVHPDNEAARVAFMGGVPHEQFDEPDPVENQAAEI